VMGNRGGSLLEFGNLVLGKRGGTGVQHDVSEAIRVRGQWQVAGVVEGD
jgi:hypothetical protein